MGPVACRGLIACSRATGPAGRSDGCRAPTQSRATPGWVARYSSKASRLVRAGMKPKSLLQRVVGEHRAIAEEPDLLGSVDGEAQHPADTQSEGEHARRDGQDAACRAARRSRGRSPCRRRRRCRSPAGRRWRRAAIAAATSSTQMNTNGDSEPRIASTRLPSHSAVIWLRTVGPRIVPMRKHDLLEIGVRFPVLREHLLDEPLVQRVRELVVAAHRIGLAQPLRVVGVVAVGGPGRGDHDAAHAGRRRRPRARCAPRPTSTRYSMVVVAPRVDDRGEVDDDVDPVPLHAAARDRRSGSRRSRRRRLPPADARAGAHRRRRRAATRGGSTSAAATCDPRKPAPPVTSTRAGASPPAVTRSPPSRGRRLRHPLRRVRCVRAAMHRPWASRCGASCARPRAMPRSGRR